MTIYPFVLQIGPIALTGYGLMMMAAFLIAGWAMQLELRRRRLNEDYAADIVVAAVVGGLVGAKLWYVVWSRDWEALFHRGGFVVRRTARRDWRGALQRLAATGAAALHNGDHGAALALGYAIGQVGCFLVNDDYGLPSTLPWAMKFPAGLPPTTVAQLSRLHAVFPRNQSVRRGRRASDADLRDDPDVPRLRASLAAARGPQPGVALRSDVAGWRVRSGSLSSSCVPRTTESSGRCRWLR